MTARFILSASTADERMNRPEWARESLAQELGDAIAGHAAALRSLVQETTLTTGETSRCLARS